MALDGDNTATSNNNNQQVKVKASLDLISSEQNGGKNHHRPQTLETESQANHHQQQDQKVTSFLRAARSGELRKIIDLIELENVDINASNANGLNALHLSTKENHREVSLELIKRGIDINSATKKGNTAVHIAALSGNLDILKILLANGGDQDMKTRSGFTGLYMAAQENHYECVKYLIENGCNTQLTTNDGFTPLDVAIQQGHKKISTYLLKALTRGNDHRDLVFRNHHHTNNGSNETRSSDSGGENKDDDKKYKLHALHLAAKKNDIKNGEFLLKKMNISPNITSKSGFTPMHIAAHYDNVDFGRLLLEETSCQINFRAKHQITPIHVASKWGKMKFLEFLLENGGDIYSKTKDQLTPLHCAARSGHLNCIELLLQQNFNLIESRTKNGLTPLHMTVQGNHIEATRYLIQVNKNGVHSLTNDSLTPLHIAVHYNYYDQCEALLENGANCYVRAMNGFTPVHIACKKKFYKILVLLMKYMNRRVEHNGFEGEVEEDQKQKRMINDGNAMQVAVEMGSIEVVKFLLENERGIKREIEGGSETADEHSQVTTTATEASEPSFLESANEKGETPLHTGVLTCNLEIIKVLMEGVPNKAATLNQGTVGDNQGPLFYALRQMKRMPDDAIGPISSEDELSPVERKKLTVVKYLMENGANLEQPTLRNHWTPFMYAVKTRQHLIVQYFIEYIKENNSPEQANEILYNLINVNRLKKNKFNSVHLAVKQNDLPMLKMLLKNGGNLNEKTVSGYTPFILACHYGHSDIIQFLLNLYEQFESNKNKIFSVYYSKGQPENVLTEGENIEESINSLYNDPNLMKKLYCDGESTEDLQIVENKYLFNINQKTDSGNTALHQAVQQQHMMVIRLLLSNKKVNANEPNNMNVTPFGLAKQFHLIEIIKEFQFVHEEKIVESTSKIINENGEEPAIDRLDGDALERLKQLMMPEDENSDDDIENEQIVREFVQARNYELNNDEINYGKRPTNNGQAAVAAIESNSNNDSREVTMNGDGGLLDYSSNVTKNLSIMDHLTDNNNGTIDQAELADEDFEEPLQPQLPPVQAGFLVSFLVDARGGEMQGCRQSGIRVIVPPKTCQQPTRITCRYLRNNAVAGQGVSPLSNSQQVTAPPLMEGESLVSQILELGPPGAKFLGPVILEIPHFASLRSSERELVVLRSENGEIWREHTSTVPTDSEGNPIPTPKPDNQKITLYCETFPNYFAIISRIRQEIFIIGPHGGRIVNENLVKRKRGMSSDVESDEIDEEGGRKSVAEEGAENVIVEAHFPENALTKNIRVGLQVLDTKMQSSSEAGNLLHFHTSPVVTIEPRRRKFHKAITLVIPIVVPSEELKNFSLKNLHLFCSITGGQHSAVWEDVTGSTPLQLFNVKGGDGKKNSNIKYISFTTTVSARFWLVYFNISPSLLALNYKFYFDEEKNKYLFSVKPGSPTEKVNESMANLNLFHYFINELNFLTKFYSYLTKIPIFCKIKMYLIKNFDEHNSTPLASEVKMKFLLLISNCVGGDVHFGQQAKLNQASLGNRSNSASCGDISSGGGEFIQLFETKKIEFIKDFEVKLKIAKQTTDAGLWSFALSKKNEHFYNENELRFTLNEVFFMNKKAFFEITFKDAICIDKQLTDNEALRFSLSYVSPAVYHSNPSGKSVQNAEIEFEREAKICSLSFALSKYKQGFLNELVQQQTHVPPRVSLKDQEYQFQSGGDFLYKEIKINLNDLVEMLNNDEWAKLGGLLNINQVDLVLIREEFPDNDKKCGMVMMKLFLKQQEQSYAEQNRDQKENFYFKIGKKLEVALIELNRFDIVEKLFRFENQVERPVKNEGLKAGLNGDLNRQKREEGQHEEEVMNEVERHEYSDDGLDGDNIVVTSPKVIIERATNEDYSDDNLDREKEKDDEGQEEEVQEEEFSISSNLKTESESENAVYETNSTQTATSPTSTSSAGDSLNNQLPSQSPSANPKVAAASSPSGIPTLKSNNNNSKNKKLKKKNKKKSKNKLDEDDDEDDQNTEKDVNDQEIGSLDEDQNSMANTYSNAKK